MGKVLHQFYGTKALVNELLDKGDARLIELDTGESEHYMHSEGGCPSETMTLNLFTEHFLEQYNYIAIPIRDEDGFYTNVAWVVCEPSIKLRDGVEFKLVVNELIGGIGSFPQITKKEKILLYLDLHRISQITPSVLGTINEIYVESLHNDPVEHWDTLVSKSVATFTQQTKEEIK
jgi:hypothetical protein